MCQPEGKTGILTDELHWVGNRNYYTTYYGDRTPATYSWILAEIIKYGRPGSILDIGCGTGLLVELSQSWGISAVGVEGSPEAVELAGARKPTLPIEHCLASQRLRFHDESFDNIVMNQVIEHLSDDVQSNVLNEANRVLKVGGVIFIYSPSKSNKEEVEKDPTHCNPLLPSSLQWKLKHCGFDVFNEPNSPYLFQRSRIGRKIGNILMRTRFKDIVSGTANAYARKL